MLTPLLPSIHYHIDTSLCSSHLLHITVSYTTTEPVHELWLPTWIPGSYLIREFAKNISALTYRINATSDDTPWQALNKHSKNSWLVSAPCNSKVEVRYALYAYDLSVRGSYVDQFRVYINPASALLAVSGLEHLPIHVDLLATDFLKGTQISPFGHAPEPITLATAMPFKELDNVRQLQADNYHHIIDSPLELASHDMGRFTAGGIDHRIYISGIHYTHMQRLAVDLQRICQAQIDLFGLAPFNQYTFMTMATDNSYGGLEHQACTSLICPRGDLPKFNETEQPSENYQRYLGLCSHEYFHAWLVKCIKPVQFMPYNLQQETPTNLLWVFEGFTSYYDDLMLYRAGVIGLDDYLKLLAGSMSRYLQAPGRHVQSLHDASTDAWIKYYRQNEYSAQSEVSYYVGGAMLAFCLDAWLGKHNRSLDTVLRDMFSLAQNQQGISIDNLQHIIAKYLGDVETAHIFNQYVLQANELPLAKACEIIGLSLNLEDITWPLGIKLGDSQNFPVPVLQVLVGSPAAHAGISAGDTLVAINSLKASKSLLQEYSGSNGSDCQNIDFFRRDELHNAVLEGSPSHEAKLYKASLSAQSTTAVAKFFTRAGP